MRSAREFKVTKSDLLTREDLKRIMAKASSSRERALIAVLLETGLTASELKGARR